MTMMQMLMMMMTALWRISPSGPWNNMLTMQQHRHLNDFLRTQRMVFRLSTYQRRSRERSSAFLLTLSVTGILNHTLWLQPLYGDYCCSTGEYRARREAINESPRFDWQTAISQSAREDTTPLFRLPVLCDCLESFRLGELSFPSGSGKTDGYTSVKERKTKNKIKKRSDDKIFQAYGNRHTFVEP